MKKNELKPSDYFDDWMDGLKDLRGKNAINRRIWRAEQGHFGKCRWNIAEGISEMLIDLGPGYRIYFCQRGKTVYLLLIGGDKDTQQRDIARAKEIKKEAEGDKTW